LPGYADALDELQQILATLESETTDVDQLADRVQRADVLIRHCRSRLDDARLRVEQVVAALDPDPDGS
jgi:exodeoxyribonuclease VII small subunit